MRRVGEDAAASPIVFVTSALVFITALAILLAATNDAGNGHGESSSTAAVIRQGDDLAALWTTSPGLHDDGSAWSCGDGLATLARPGLALSGGLDACKVRDLQRAPATADGGDDLLSYSEALGMLVLPDNTGFHLRTRPILDPHATVVAAGGLDLDIAYLQPPAPTALNTAEAAALTALLKVAPATYDTDNPAPPHALKTDMEAGNVDVLVVGSDVDHTALVSLLADPTTDALPAWVAGGGTLVVLPSSGMEASWVAGLWTTGDASSSGGLRDRDPSHPLLQSANRLMWQGYAVQANGLDLAGAEAFFHSVGTTGVASVSDAGAFGDGQVIAWNVHPTTSAGSADAAEGGRILHNTLVRHHQALFLDYGAGADDDTALQAGRRWTTMTVPNPMDTGQDKTIAVEFLAYVFPA